MKYTIHTKKRFQTGLFLKNSKKGFLFGMLCILLLGFPARAYSQNSPTVNVQLKGATIDQVFKEIERQSGYSFFYLEKDLNLKTKSDYTIKDKTIDAALKIILKNQPVSYTIKEKHIILSKNKAEPSQKTPAPRSGRVSGVVTDARGEVVVGASIYDKKTSTGAVTDLNGTFSISTSPDNILSIKYMGYTPQDITVKDMTTFYKIVLEDDQKKLEDVVVVGYGTQKKVTAIGSQSSITVAELKAQPIANMTNAIAGRIAGIVGVQRSGEPGYDGSEIYIRGISSFTSGNSTPLVLVDGIERSFNNVDAEDIASFSVLKDASATAVYGVRGANGVILIETKKGKAGKPKINMRANQGITQFTKVPEFADGVTYMEMANEAYRNTNPYEIKPKYSEEAIQKTAEGSDPDLYPNINWVKELFKKNGENRRVNMNVNGGSENAKFYLSLGYYNEDGMYKTDDMAQYNSSVSFTRYNFTSNLNLQLLKNTRLDFGASGWISDGNFPGASSGDIWNSAFVLPPIAIPAVYSNGYMSRTRTGDVNNPYDLITHTGYVSELKSQLWSNIRLTQDLSPFIKGLSIYGMFSFDNFNFHKISRTKTVDAYLATGRDENGQLTFDQMRIGSSYLGYGRDNGGNRQFYTEAALNYNRTFGKSDVSGMVLYNQSDKSDAFAGDFITSIPTRFQGFAARSTYAYDNRYMAEVNLGYNGSETFIKGKRFGLFPSYGLGWIASNEKFFEPFLGTIQFLKFRGSYGTVGNSKIDGRRFAYIATVASKGGYSYGKTANINFDGLDVGEYAADVTWERSDKMNLGAEIHAMNDGLNLIVDYFTEDRTGIFLQRGDLPNYAGVLSSPWGNLGEIKNKGVEATLTLNKRFNKDLMVEFRGNFTWNRATIVENANAPWPYPWQQHIGRKLGQRFGKIALGLFGSQEEIANSPTQTGSIQPGDIKYKDLNGDGTIDSYDEGPIGFGSIPEIVYGFGPSVTYKGFAAGAWFKGISNVDISLGGEGFQPFSQEGTRGNLLSAITDRWTPENPGNNHLYPRLLYPSSANTNYDGSSWWIKNGAFLRLQNVEISYTFHQSNWLKNLGVDNFRIYAQGYNILTLSEFKLWDVELGDGKGASYPLTKTYNLGIDFQF